MIGGLYLPHIRNRASPTVQVVIPPTSPGSLVFPPNGFFFFFKPFPPNGLGYGFLSMTRMPELVR